MKRNIIATLVVMTALMCLTTACNNREQMIAEIQAAEESLNNEGILIVTDTTRANSMVAQYIAFADKYPDDSLAPVYLYRASDITLSIGNSDENLTLLERIISNYDDFSELSTCYLTKAITLENEERYDEAKEAYEEFLRLFPDDVMADDVKQMLPYVGMSPEEMLTQIMTEKK